MSRIVLLDPKLTPHVNFNNFQAEENFFIFKIFGTSRWRKSSSNTPDWSILLKFGQNVPQRQKLEVTKFRHHRVRGFWLSAVSLVIRPLSLPPPGLIGLKLVETFFIWAKTSSFNISHFSRSFNLVRHQDLQEKSLSFWCCTFLKVRESLV